MRTGAGLATLMAFAPAAGVAAEPPTTPAEPPAKAETAVQGVVVTVQRPRVQTLIDRKVYNVSDDLQSTSGTAADVLNNIPSVEVDADGNVTVRGDSNVTILIDGKPSAEFSGAAQGASLLQIPASDIDRIEVLTNPPAQYKAEGSGGVINIITKSRRQAGLSGVGQATLGNDRRGVAALNGAWNSGKLSLSGGVTLRKEYRDRLTDTDRTTIDPISLVATPSREAIDERFHRLIPLAKLGLGYRLDAADKLDLSLSHRELSGHRYFDQHDETGAAAAPVQASDRHSDGHEWSVDEGEKLSLEHRLGRPDETLSLSLQRSVLRERERYAYTDVETLPVAPLTRSDLHLSLDLITTEFSLDYALPLPGERTLKLGYDYEANDNRFDNRGDTLDPVSGQAADNPAVTSHFRYHQKVQALYGQYQTPVGRWTLQGGVRLEQTDVRTLLITGDIAGGESYFRAYPTLHLDRSLSEATKVSLSVSRRIVRPDPEALNPFVDVQDTHNLRAGNARLLPQDSWAYEVGYASAFARISYGLTGYYRFTRDSVTDVIQVVSTDVVLATKANLPKIKAAGLEFNASGKLLKTLSFGVSGVAFDQQFDARAIGGLGLRSTAGLNLKAVNSRANLSPLSL